jgi:hypothetical protein
MPTTRGNLQAATIYEADEESGEKVDGGIEIPCMFNPFEYTVTKQNTYREEAQDGSEVPHFEFQKAGPQTLRLSLVFDTYESGDDVSETTNQLWRLMETRTRQEGDENIKIPPPAVAFEWGVFRFVAVITNMSQRFILFRSDGTPVRAKVEVTFTQHRDLNDYPQQDPGAGGTDVRRVWRVVAGDRLDTIAHQVYGDAAKWRTIAEQNHITDPLALRPGQQLSIPVG